MKLVIDTSSIISALIKNGISRRIIVSPAIQFVTPDHSLKEISKYKELICKKAKINSNEFDIILNLLFEKIIIIPKEEYEEFFDAANFKTRKEITIYRTRELALAFKPRKK